MSISPLRRYILFVIAAAVAIGAAIIEGTAQPVAPSAEPGSALGAAPFASGKWTSEAKLLRTGITAQDLSAAPAIFSKLISGINPSSVHPNLGRWGNHPFFPTISTNTVKPNWSQYSAVSVGVNSEVATGEDITLVVESDSTTTPWLDFYYFDFTVNWIGWRQIVIPFTNFSTFGQVAGWNQVGAVRFCTKIFNHQPNPYTVVYFDQLQLTNVSGLALAATERVQPRTGPRSTAAGSSGSSPVQFTEDTIPFDPALVNHQFQEITTPIKAVAPVQQMPYFKAERATVGYYPKFNVAPPSFDPSGHVLVKYGGLHVQTLRADRSWSLIDLTPYTRAYLAKTTNWRTVRLLNNGFYDDPYVRFDARGRAYVLVLLGPVGKAGAPPVIGLLLFSNDGLKTWSVQRLAYPFARFERMDGNNRDALNRPPLILLHNYWASTNRAGYLLVPEIRQDGSLLLPAPIKIADSCIPFSQHSGNANFVVSANQKAFIVYGVTDQTKRPPIPSEHPALQLSYRFNGQTVFSRNGTPAFVVEYDLAARSLSAPVFLGFGGHQIDPHDWPGLSIDSVGFLHAIINGHNEPLYYTRSVKPLDITRWSNPLLLGNGLSYSSLNIDTGDSIYMISRNSSRGYFFDLTLSTKRPNRSWNLSRPLVQAAKPYYKNWGNNVTIDSVGRLYLTYYSQSNSWQLFKDEFDAFFYIWPDLEEKAGKDNGGTLPLPKGTYKTPVKSYVTINAPFSEPTILASDPGGQAWRLATSPDLLISHSLKPKPPRRS